MAGDPRPRPLVAAAGGFRGSFDFAPLTGRLAQDDSEMEAPPHPRGVSAPGHRVQARAACLKPPYRLPALIIQNVRLRLNQVGRDFGVLDAGRMPGSTLGLNDSPMVLTRKPLADSQIDFKPKCVPGTLPAASCWRGAPIRPFPDSSGDAR